MSSPPPEIVVYTLPWCRYCARAKSLLRRRGLSFEEIDGSSILDFRSRLVKLSGASTVPQIVIDAEPVGGSDDLARLDRLGVLDALARGRPFPIEYELRHVSPRTIARWTLARARGDRAASPVERVAVIVDRQGRLVEAKRVS